MRDYAYETGKRVEYIRGVVTNANAGGIVFANSGGKDCMLVGILCKAACENTVSLILPCGSKRNYGEDKDHAESFARQFNISTRVIDLSEARSALIAAIGENASLSVAATANIAARLRMNALYAVAASENRLVAGTGNRSERHMGYFTKWGDGAFDFNPIADLTVTEVYEFLRILKAPEFVFGKAPSAGLVDGQTDEGDMGVLYRSIDDYLLKGATNERDTAIIERYHKSSEHKRVMPLMYDG